MTDYEVANEANRRISRSVCDKVAYGYFPPQSTPSVLDYDDASVRLALCLKNQNKESGGGIRELMKDGLPPSLYQLTLEKLADGECD